MTIQNVAIVASLLIGGGGLTLGVLNYRRDAERLALDRERRADEVKASKPQLKIMPGTVSGQGLANEQPVFSVDVQNWGGPDAPRVFLEATLDGQTYTSQQFVSVPSGGGEQPRVVLPQDWAMAGNNAVRAGVTFRIYDEITGAEDTLTVP